MTWQIADGIVVHQASGRTFDLGKCWFEPSTHDVMPRKPSGDQREKTITELLRDGVPDPRKGASEEWLRAGSDAPLFTAADIAGSDAHALGDILVDHYFVRTTQDRRFLFPFQTALPANYVYRARYKMFDGSILSFLGRSSEGVLDEDLVDRFYALFNSTDGLSLADQLFLDLAMRDPQPDDAPPPQREKAATAAHLDEATKLKQVPVYFPEAHRLFRQDLASALEIASFGRRDHVHAVLAVLFLHIALYYWRAAWELEEQVQAVGRFFSGDATAADVPPATSGTFAGQIKFRVATGAIRPIAKTDGAAASYVEVNEQRLLLFPLNVSLLQLLRKIIETADGAPADSRRLPDLAAMLERDDGLMQTGREALAAVARDRAADLGGAHPADIGQRLQTPGQEFAACRDVLLSTARGDLRRYSRDITAAVMKRGSRGIMHTRGSVGYFELGQDLLLLISRLVAGSSGRSMPFKDFIARLGERGLAPQDRAEEQLLAEALRNLNVLEKHADAGEAMYVRHFL